MRQFFNPLIKRGIQYALNHLSTATLDGLIISPAALSTDQHAYDPVDFGKCSLIRMETTSDIDITGFQSPPVGLNRIFAITNITGNKIKFKDSDGGTMEPENRILLKDGGDRTIKENETAIFWYDHESERWRVYNKVG